MEGKSHLLVGLVGTFRVVYLCLEAVLFGDEVLEKQDRLVFGKQTYPDTDQVSKLGISVNVHIDNTVANSGGDLRRGSRSAVKDEVAANSIQPRISKKIERKKPQT